MTGTDVRAGSCRQILNQQTLINSSFSLIDNSIKFTLSWHKKSNRNISVSIAIVIISHLFWHYNYIVVSLSLVCRLFMFHFNIMKSEHITFSDIIIISQLPLRLTTLYHCDTIFCNTLRGLQAYHQTRSNPCKSSISATFSRLLLQTDVQRSSTT